MRTNATSLIFLMTICIIANPVFGQLIIRNSSQAVLFKVLSNGKVGIGLGSADPDELLTVNGKTKTSSLQVGTSSTTGHVLISSDASGTAGWNTVGSNGITDGDVAEMDLDVSNSPQADQVLGWNGTAMQWRPSGMTNWTKLSEPRSILIRFQTSGDYGVASVYYKDGPSNGIGPDGSPDGSWIPAPLAWYDAVELTESGPGVTFELKGIKASKALLGAGNEVYSGIVIRSSMKDLNESVDAQGIIDFAADFSTVYYTELSCFPRKEADGSYGTASGICSLTANGELYIYSQYQGAGTNQNVEFAYFMITGYLK
ncbi:hypothetical protein GF407_02480 [candidate division KSB1 bacterium]|nr:hypothetical protein [candidate division KSB1 bacterium]